MNPPKMTSGLRVVSEIPAEHVDMIGVGSAGLTGVGWEKRGDRRGTFGSGRGSDVYGGRVFGQRTRSTGVSTRPSSSASSPKARQVFAVGDQVSHKTFGPGQVVAVDGDIIEVQFKRTGARKKLMRGFAPLVKIEG